MNSLIYTAIMTMLWILNLFNDSGFGQAYQTTERARTVIVLLFLILIIFECKQKSNHLSIARQDFLVFGLFFVLAILISYIRGYGYMGVHYISVFMLVYILGKIRVHSYAMKWVSVIYMFLGILILYIFDYKSVLSGWNGNTIGMIGLYSFLIFLISFYDVKNLKNKLIILLVTGIYAWLIAPTDSRSSILFAIIAVLFAFSILPRKIILKNNKRYYWWLLLPLFIAIFVVIISHGSYMKNLDAWSLSKFDKPLFNGRDELWESGFNILKKYVLFGSGTVEGNWHNCVVTVLVAYGCVGCCLWIKTFQKILAKGRYWINDKIVSGCIITFIIMYVQQSVELGLINEKPNILPYVVLGIMLGRVRLLDKRKTEG